MRLANLQPHLLRNPQESHPKACALRPDTTTPAPTRQGASAATPTSTSHTSSYLDTRQQWQATMAGGYTIDLPPSTDIIQISVSSAQLTQTPALVHTGRPGNPVWWCQLIHSLQATAGQCRWLHHMLLCCSIRCFACNRSPRCTKIGFMSMQNLSMDLQLVHEQ